MRRVKQKVQKLTETSEASLCDEGDSLVELGTMMKSLEPITKQVEDLKGNMSQCVEDVDNLSMVDLLRVVSEIGESMYARPPLYGSRSICIPRLTSVLRLQIGIASAWKLSSGCVPLSILLLLHFCFYDEVPLD